VQIPSTQPALWCWLRGEDRGELLLRGKEITRDLSEAFHLDGIIEGFKFGGADLGRDLTGYEDGTENPVGNAAADAAIVKNGEPGMGGSSFAAVQLWKHDLETFSSMPQQQQDLIIGRRKSDNEEIDDAPESAHVKRTAQESFNPEAFLLRRSMPWADGSGEGLMFVAFGCSVDAFEAQLTRMAGLEDTIVDAIFRFSVPVTGSYYWCPPMRDDHLDLSALQD
jgi:putative iron-dependent peroxidase